MPVTIDSNILKTLFTQVYFVNGTAYAGKSTVVHLLAEKYGGIECGENFHMPYLRLADPVHQPNLCYFDTMSGWAEFLSRTPEQYAAWIRNSARETVPLEVLHIAHCALEGKPVFVDTNIPCDILREISDKCHVALMLAPQEMSVDRFFDRPDAEKQFLYQELLKMPDPEKAIANFRACMAACNSDEVRREFLESGFFVWHRTAQTTVQDALAAVETHFFPA